jgi:hypothetical protein
LGYCPLFTAGRDKQQIFLAVVVKAKVARRPSGGRRGEDRGGGRHTVDRGFGLAPDKGMDPVGGVGGHAAA